MNKILFSLLIVSSFCIQFSFAQNIMTPEKVLSLQRVSAEMISKDQKTVYYGISNPDLAANKNERNIYKISLSDKTNIQITKETGAESGLQEMNDGKILYSYKGNIWVMNADGSSPSQVTKGSESYNNFRVSPDGSKIYFTRDVKVRKTIADTYPDLPKANAIVTDELIYRHWDTWEDEFASHVFVANFSNYQLSNEVDIMKDELFDCPQQPMGGTEDIAWSKDSKSIYYVCKKKTGKEYAVSTNTDIYQYTISTANTFNMSSGMMGYDTNPLCSNDGKRLAWLSMRRDGYEADKNDIIIYDNDAKQKYNLTKLWDYTVESFVYSNDNKKIFFLAYFMGTEQLFEISLQKDLSLNNQTHIRKITDGDFDVNGIVGESSTSLVVSRTDMNHAAELFTVDIKTGLMSELTTVNKEVYSKMKLCKVEKKFITTTDKQKMLVWVIYPPDFSPTKKYPTILYCQGGPQSAVSQFYSYRWNFQVMASKGYIVVAPNRRGLPGFGVRWNEDISKNWGGQAIIDYITAIDTMCLNSYVDKTRLAAVGASYGGYSVYMLAGVHQGRFKTFISHCGLFDLKSWYGSTEEMWFANWDIGGPYWGKNAPDSYTKSNPIEFAQNWRTPILVIHGGLDFRVPSNQGMEAYQLAQLKGIKSRFLYFPEEGHWILQPQNSLLWMREFYKWLDETL
jgi:dipeptidyl aminopeptidase/acylaminoacyl peptidase